MLRPDPVLNEGIDSAALAAGEGAGGGGIICAAAAAAAVAAAVVDGTLSSSTTAAMASSASPLAGAAKMSPQSCCALARAAADATICLPLPVENGMLFSLGRAVRSGASNAQLTEPRENRRTSR